MDIYAPPYWLASPDKLPPETTEMTVTFDNPMHTEQKEKIEKPEKINNRKTEKKENESHHQYVQKMIKTSNAFTAPSDNKAVPEITNTQSKYPPVFRGRMRPDQSISHHPAFPMLHKYATEGCLVDWRTMDHGTSRSSHTQGTTYLGKVFASSCLPERRSIGKSETRICRNCELG